MFLMSDECIMLEDKILTHDEVLYTVPEQSERCEVILSRDCSLQNVFTIITTLSREASNRKIDVFIPKYRIEMWPDRQVNVNGETLQLINDNPYYIREAREER